MKVMLRQLAAVALAFGVSAGGVVAGTGAAEAHDYKVGDLTIDHPWTRATPPKARAGGAYMMIMNAGDAEDRLIGGSSPVAERIEIHEMAVENDVMRMREVEGGIAVPAGGSVELKPGGYHVMLMGLKEQLEEGQDIPLTLEFKDAGLIDVVLTTEAIGAGGHDHGHGHGHDGEAKSE